MIPHSKPTLRDSDFRTVMNILHSNQIAQGPVVKAFEEKLSGFVGVTGSVAVSSGTAALHLSLLLLEIGPGDEVIIPSYVCPALLNAVYYVGAIPILADIKDDFNIDEKEAKRKVTSRTKAIIAPHMYGLPANIEALMGFGVPLIEDCAHALGASYKGRKVGSFGTLSVFSFYATKVICTGEGGMVLTSSESLVEKLRDLRDYTGSKDNYAIRYNYRMTDMQAALGISQLNQLPAFVARRRQIAALYNDELSKYDLTIPKACGSKGHIYYRYVVIGRTKAEQVRRAFYERGVSCGRGVLKPLHRQLGLDRQEFPNTESAVEYGFSLPIYPSLSDTEVELILQASRQILSHEEALFR